MHQFLNSVFRSVSGNTWRLPLFYCAVLLLMAKTGLTQTDPTSIEIIRDNYGVPHIFAATDAQVAYGLAWAHAEDDFKTIQETFLPTKGLLGRHMGKQGAVLDYLVELLRCRESVEAHYNDLSKDVLKVVEGYVAGLNRYAETHPEEVLVKGTFPVTVKEYLTGFNLVIHFYTDSGNIIRDLFNDKVEPSKEMSDNNVQDKKIGSNAFAISGKKTTDGKTYFNVNTHQPLTGPFCWYEAHVVSQEGWNMLGGLFPGSPCPFIGTNTHLGWTHTYNYPDLIDTYQLEMHPKDKNKYKFDGKWLELEKRKVKLRIKLLGKLNLRVKRTAYWCKYGPVIKNKTGYFSFHSGAFDKITAIDQWYQMNKATNFSEFKEALEIIGVPRFNVMYADRYDTIFYISNALLPVREGNYDWTQVLPGNTSSTITTGYHQLNELPQVMNPECGYLFNTNNSPFNCTDSTENPALEDHEKTFSFREGMNNRSRRFMDLMADYDKLSYMDFKRIKYDQEYPQPIIAPFDVNGVFRLDRQKYPELDAIIQIFKQWDHKSDTANIGAAHWRMHYKYLKGIVEERKLDKDDSIPEPIVVEALTKTKEFFEKHYGTLQVPFGDFQKHVRGDRAIPLSGLEDVIAAINVEPYKESQTKATSGESYIMLIRYSKDDIEIETVVPYGSSNHKGNPHYDDQMEMYRNQQLKKMTLNESDVRKNAVRLYHPE